MTITKDEILARRAQSNDRLLEVSVEIQRAFAPRQQAITRKLVNVAEKSGSVRNKMFVLQGLMSEVRESAAAFVPCHRGCSMCCYQRLVMAQIEADAIGQAIGTRAKILPKTQKIKAIKDYGRNTPCTFLKEGECSIYDHRPLACRNHLNLDVDPLLCSFENLELAVQTGEAIGIPMLGPTPVHEVYARLTAGDVLGDIRDFFPPS